MNKKALIVAITLSLPLCASAIDFGNVLKNSGGTLLKAATITPSQVMAQSRAAVKQMDAQQESQPADARYTKRLNSLVNLVTLPKIDGVKFNFKVYKSEPDNLNAFATPDGSIRFHTALMDAMTDEQVLAVLGHEIGHVVEKHSFRQMRKALLSQAAIRAAAGESATGAEIYSQGGGNFANSILNASFSKSDEISADKYSLKILQEADANPEAMIGAIEVLKEAYGNGGGMMSSHPSNKRRMKKLEKSIAKMNKKKS